MAAPMVNAGGHALSVTLDCFVDLFPPRSSNSANGEDSTMNTDKMMYWVALGVLAVGLHSEYRNGRFPALHRVANQTGSTLCRIVTRAEQTVATARIVTGQVPQESRVDDEFVARQQDQAERVIAEHQADLDRVLAEHQGALDHAMALRQANLDCLHQKLDRMRVALDRAQLQRTRTLERMRFKLTNAANHRTIVVCPRTGARITIDAKADLSNLGRDIPAIDVGESF